MSIGPYHLGRYSSIGSRPYVRGAIQESDDLVSHHQRVGGTVRGLTIQDARTMEHLRNVPIYSGGFEVASDGNGNEIDTLFNVNGKNPEDDNQTPQTGMSFSSELEAEEYYKKYAKRKGFTVRKGKVRKRNGTTTWRCFLCSCEGIRAKKHSNQGTKYQRSETRTGCNAQIQVKLDNGQWVITKLHLEHNHRLQCLDTLNWPSDEPNGPSDEPNGLSDELNWPSDEWNGLSDELNGPSDELEGASGADKEIQTSFAPTEAEDRDETLTDPNTAAGLPEMVEGSELTLKEVNWQRIVALYGGVTANCSFEESAVQTKCLEVAKYLTLEIVKLMQENTARSLSDYDFNFIAKALSDIKKMHCNVDWLRRLFVARQPLIEYAQAERNRDVIRGRLNEKIAEVERLVLELDQADASLQVLQHRIPAWLRIEDTLGKPLL